MIKKILIFFPLILLATKITFAGDITAYSLPTTTIVDKYNMFNIYLVQANKLGSVDALDSLNKIQVLYPNQYSLFYNYIVAKSNGNIDIVPIAEDILLMSNGLLTYDEQKQIKASLNQTKQNNNNSAQNTNPYSTSIQNNTQQSNQASDSVYGVLINLNDEKNKANSTYSVDDARNNIKKRLQKIGHKSFSSSKFCTPEVLYATEQECIDDVMDAIGASDYTFIQCRHSDVNYEYVSKDRWEDYDTFFNVYRAKAESGENYVFYIGYKQNCVDEDGNKWGLYEWFSEQEPVYNDEGHFIGYNKHKDPTEKEKKEETYNEKLKKIQAHSMDSYEEVLDAVLDLLNTNTYEEIKRGYDTKYDPTAKDGMGDIVPDKDKLIRVEYNITADDGTKYHAVIREQYSTSGAWILSTFEKKK